MIEIFADIGFEPTETMAVQVQDGGNYLLKSLFDDYYSAVLFNPEEPLDCTLYVGCNRFSNFMDLIESDENRSEYSEYLRRKLRKDRWGTLAFARLGIELSSQGANFSSAGIKLDENKLRKVISELQSPNAVREFLFGSDTGRFLAAIEGLWVFSFLAFEMSLSAQDLFDEIETKEMQMPWRLSGKIGLPVLQRLQIEYAERVRN